LKGLPSLQLSATDHNLIAQSYYSLGHWQDALNEWRSAGNNSTWLAQATCCSRLGLAEQAKAILSNALSWHAPDPQIAAAATLLARYLNKDQTTVLWQRVLNQSPQCGDTALYNLAWRATDS